MYSNLFMQREKGLCGGYIVGYWTSFGSGLSHIGLVGV